MQHRSQQALDGFLHVSSQYPKVVVTTEEPLAVGPDLQQAI
jgi:hypothetical protein